MSECELIIRVMQVSMGISLALLLWGMWIDPRTHLPKRRRGEQQGEWIERIYTKASKSQEGKDE